MQVSWEAPAVPDHADETERLTAAQKQAAGMQAVKPAFEVAQSGQQSQKGVSIDDNLDTFPHHGNIPLHNEDI